MIRTRSDKIFKIFVWYFLSLEFFGYAFDFGREAHYQQFFEYIKYLLAELPKVVPRQNAILQPLKNRKTICNSLCFVLCAPQNCLLVTI